MDKNIPDDKRTMLVVQDIANSIDDMIKMTVDIPSNYDDRKVPMLDVKAWVEENSNEIYYEFYEKPTKNPLVISKDSAMPKSKKINTISQEVFRRLHNTKHEIDWKRKTEILEKYMKELKASGYSESDRQEVLKSGIKRYESLRRKEEKGERPFFRSRDFQRNERDEDKERKRGSWFKQNNNKYKTVFFVPPTPNSVLLKMLKQTEEHNMISEDERVKFVETCGTKYIDYLKTPSPFNEKCKDEENCIVCKNSKANTDCRVSNVGYSIKCKLCNERNKDISYEGETARNGYIRQREHMKELEKKNKRSVLYKHMMTNHKNEESEVKFNNPLNRQIEELTWIRSKNPSSQLEVRIPRPVYRKKSV